MARVGKGLVLKGDTFFWVIRHVGKIHSLIISICTSTSLLLISLRLRVQLEGSQIVDSSEVM